MAENVVIEYSPGARMLLGIAIGDAYGAPFENLSHQEACILHKNQGLIPGRYTDDTQQALAIAELLVSGDPVNPHSLARVFLDVYRRDPRPGYSTITRNMLGSDSPESFLNSITLEKRKERKTDGAAMRALPIGFFPDRNDVIQNSMMSASITHGHPDAIVATLAIALLAHEQLYHNTPMKRIWSRIREQIRMINPGIIPYCDTCSDLTIPDRERILGKYAAYGVPYTESRIFLGAVISLLAIYGDDPCTLLLESVLFGGDTDTVAAVVLGACLIRTRKDNRIWSLVTGLENGPYGKDYLIKKGEQVSGRFPLDNWL